MKRINYRAAAVEAVITRHGTVVGPLMTDLTGHPELTPHKGGWCGNDIFPEALSPEHRERARVLTQLLGDRLAGEGYRGFLEIDYLADVDTGELYLGEINPRISGVTSMTNVTAGAYADVPLFLFHLLEFLDVDYEIDVDDINRRWAAGRRASTSGARSSSRTPATRSSSSRGAPKTGIWRMDDARRARVRPLGQRLAQPARRVRGVLPARARARRLPLSRRRPRRARRPLADADRGQRAHASGRTSGSTGSTGQFAGAAAACRRRSRCRRARWRSRPPDGLVPFRGVRVPRGRRAAARPAPAARFEATWPAYRRLVPARRRRRAAVVPGGPRRAATRTCPSSCPRGSGSWRSPAAETWPRACSRSTTRRRW